MIEGFDLLAEGHLAGDLTAAETQTFTAHLATCAPCRTRFEAHQAAAAKLAALTTTPLAPISADFTKKVLAKLPAGPPPKAPAAASPIAMIIFAIGVASIAGAGVTLATRPRPAHRIQAGSPQPPASPGASAAASPSTTPLPEIARPSAGIGGLGDDTGGGKLTR